MIELFLVLIIISAFICVFSVIIGISSKKKVFPLVSVCCGVLIMALAFCCAIELREEKSTQNEIKETVKITTSAHDKNIKKNTEKSEIHAAEKTEAYDENRIVYITKTGEKYHFSYNCSDADFYECTLKEALELGLEPCGRCTE